MAVLNVTMKYVDTIASSEAMINGLLANCPHCGGDNLEIVNTHTAYYTVRCLFYLCEAEISGKSFDKRFHTKKSALRCHALAAADACRRWNRRGDHYDNTESHYQKRVGDHFRHLRWRSTT